MRKKRFRVTSFEKSWRLQSQSMTSNIFDDVFDNVRKTWNNAKKKLKAADLKRKMALVLRWTTFRVAFSEKLRSFHKKFPHWASHVSIFFLPQILYPFQFVILLLQIFEKKPLVSKLFFCWRRTNHLKKNSTWGKKNGLVNYSYVFQTKMVVKCKGFVIQRNFFFFSTLALFEQLDWKENGVACKFPLLNVPLFFPKLQWVLKKKD